MADIAQNLKTHRRIVPMYHVGVFFPLLIHLVWACYRLVQMPGGDTIVQTLLAIALMLMFISVRTQILTVQDRVIRLEMQLRLTRVLTPDQHGVLAQLTPKQLVALRFASDAELPALVSQVVSGQLRTQQQIKAHVRDWQADFLRA
ncbi:MAG: DUF6526 family protein [Vicinamibacterales bacterium]